MASPPADVVVLGAALDTLGFEGNLTIAGLGLNTKGFLWPCSGIWQPGDYRGSLVTAWSSIGATVSTTWTSSNTAGLTTVWVTVVPPNANTETCVDGDVIGSNTGLGGEVLGTESGGILGTEGDDEIGI